MRLKQCGACPWKVATVPARDIPGGYCAVKHANPKITIALQAELPSGPLRAMACHEHPEGAEEMCVGWIAHQLGPGNNLALRLQALRDKRFYQIVLDGPQHETFEVTLTND